MFLLLFPSTRLSLSVLVKVLKGYRSFLQHHIQRTIAPDSVCSCGYRLSKKVSILEKMWDTSGQGIR